MPDIVLTTLNARYWHTSFGLRYLLANMGELEQRTSLHEFGIGDRTVDMVSTILADNPRIVGVGVYIWNVEPATRLVADLKQVRPDLTIVLGGPEVSYETEHQEIIRLADYVVTGEADLAFPKLCHNILNHEFPETKIIHAGVPVLSEVRLPYDLYSDADIADRIIYVEISRGCPFTCEFCLSALDIPVRLFDPDEFLKAMQSLLDRGARQFKFVDRTFNLNMRISSAVLQFFLDRYEPGLFLHFELIPDRLPDSLRKLITQFPPGVLQFEIGVQTFNEQVGELISRHQDNEKLAENFRFLRQETGVHVHADLIVGLPGESLQSFAEGFDRLLNLEPQEIQVGILKRLKGTPITRHDQTWNMVYSQYPPFEILSNQLLDFETIHRLRRFARFWDLVANSGNFPKSCPMIWLNQPSPFHAFLNFCDWIFAQEQRLHAISLGQLAERLFEFLTQQQRLPVQQVAESIWHDYVRGGRKDRPSFLKSFTLPAPHEVIGNISSAVLPTRQARHAH